MKGALLRYRVLANVVGVILVVFLLLAMPLKYLAGEEWLAEHIAQPHGFSYMVYLAFTFDLARRAGWSTWRTLGVMLAGTVPFLSFVVERRNTRELKAAA